MPRNTIATISEWIDSISALWKVGALVALLGGATIGMIRTGSGQGESMKTHIAQTDSILHEHHTLVSQNDTIIYQLRELNRRSAEQICVETHARADWGDCIK